MTDRRVKFFRCINLAARVKLRDKLKVGGCTMPLLEGKVAVITGASSGIGRSMALLFAREGARVVIGDIREEPREEGEKPTHQEIMARGGEAVFQKTDVSSLNDLRNLMNKAVETYQSLDILVNNAGIFMMKPNTEVTEEEYDGLMTINVKGTYFAARFAAEIMLKNQTRGSIINLSSIAGINGFGDMSTYCTSKGAVTNLTRALAAELGPAGIRVNAINPGVIATKMTEVDVPIVGKFTKAVPLGRDGEVREIADCALFLASDAASFVNGVNLPADGGFSAT